MNSDNCILTIIVPVYNHENYIEQTLMSIYNQKTDYKYQVYIGEDKSTDNTRSVLMELQKKLPDNFVFLYREKNLGSGNFYDLCNYINTKYYAVLEGDDYWCDDNKIQTQIDFLEKHDEYMGVSHWVNVVDKNSNPSSVIVTHIEGEYTYRDYKNSKRPGHTSSKVVRSEFINYKRMYAEEFPDLKYPGDQIEAFLFACFFRVYCIPKKMSCYRFVRDSGTSYSATNKFDNKAKINKIKYFYSNYVFAKEKNGNKKIIKLSHKQYIFYMYRFRKDLNIPKEMIKREIKDSKMPLGIYMFIISRAVKAAVRKIDDKLHKDRFIIRP